MSTTASAIDAKFQAGVAFVQNSKDVKLDTNTQLLFYGYYKVAQSGQCNTPAPSRLKVVEYKKYQAWKTASKTAATPAAAKELYLKELDAKVPDWNKAKL